MHPFKNVRRRAALLGLLLILSTAAAAQAQSRARDLGFRFDPTRSQQFLWPQETTRAKSVVSAQSKTEVLVDWPRLAPGTNTLFLELQVDVPTRAQRGAEPAVTMRRGEITRVQYFEPGAEGRRFLNLSDLIAAQGEGLRLTAAGMSLLEQNPPGHFVSFINRDLEPLRTLVIAPHPDDAEIATFGVYATTDADVVTVTSGDAGGQNFESLYPEPGDHYRIKGWIRTWDSITVPFFGGVSPERARNLGYYDASLKELFDKRPAPVDTPLAALKDPGFYRRLNVNKRLAETPFVATWPGLVDSLVLEIQSTEPDVILAAHPWLDAHWDHQYASIALFEALASLQKTGDPSAKNCELYLYTNHMVDAEIYPFGPRDGFDLAARSLTIRPGCPAGRFERTNHPAYNHDRQELTRWKLHSERDYCPRFSDRRTRKTIRPAMPPTTSSTASAITARPKKLSMVFLSSGAQQVGDQQPAGCNQEGGEDCEVSLPGLHLGSACAWASEGSNHHEQEERSEDHQSWQQRMVHAVANANRTRSDHWNLLIHAFQSGFRRCSNTAGKLSVLEVHSFATL